MPEGNSSIRHAEKGKLVLVLTCATLVRYNIKYGTKNFFLSITSRDGYIVCFSNKECWLILAILQIETVTNMILISGVISMIAMISDRTLHNHMTYESTT